MPRLDFFFNTGLFQYGVGSMAAFGADRHRKLLVIDGGLPEFMTALGLPGDGTAMAFERGNQLFVDVVGQEASSVCGCAVVSG